MGEGSGNRFLPSRPADPTAHIDVTIGSSRPGWIDVEADAGVTSFAQAATSTRDIEKFLHRCIDYAGQSAVFGMTITQLLALFFLPTPCNAVPIGQSR